MNIPRASIIAYGLAAAVLASAINVSLADGETFWLSGDRAITLQASGAESAKF